MLQMAIVPAKRDFLHTITYYFFRVFGPSMLTIGIVGIAAMNWFLLIFPLSPKTGKALVAIIFLIDLFPLFMYLYSIIYAISIDNGTLLEALRNNVRNHRVNENLIRSLPVCEKCGLPKPPRCHHCSFCNKCHLRMDHHCPALGKCVALRNMQPFLVMLTWGEILTTTFIVQLIFPYFLLEEFIIIVYCMTPLLLVLLICLVGLKCDVMHRVKSNTTVVELLSSSSRPYDLGYDENLRQVLGTGKFRFLIPRKSTMTGFEWAEPKFRNDMNPTENRDYEFKNVDFA